MVGNKTTRVALMREPTDETSKEHFYYIHDLGFASSRSRSLKVISADQSPYHSTTSIHVTYKQHAGLLEMQFGNGFDHSRSPNVKDDGSK
jgi:hypothetical protein